MTKLYMLALRTILRNQYMILRCLQDDARVGTRKHDQLTSSMRETTEVADRLMQ